MSHVIVLGGGLSGLSAAHTILQSGGNTILLDKNPFMGGNSTKATSGINGAGTDAQKKLGIKDSVEIFEKDTALGGSKKQTEIPTELQRVLTGNSPHAVNWLKSAFGLDLTLVSRLGGHSMPRTHRGKEKFPGMVITYALMQEYERICEETPGRAQLHLKARATQLLQDDDGNVIGVKYEKDGKSNSLYGPVVIATGGYGAGGLSKTSLLHDVRPDLTHLPTTNGTHCTGDGVSMVRAINGGTVDLNDVQVHPTGLVSPVDPDARVKFLAAGALRGCGGVILDNKGHRFCDELGTRDYVTGRMWEHKSGPYRLVLNGAASNEIEWHCKHYQGRGLMKKFDSGAALAQEIGCSVSTLEKTFEAYNTSAKTLKDPWNKKFFPNTPLKTNDYFYVAQITPVVHYTMGGVNILPTGEVTKADGTTPIKGLFAAGEAVGGVHGRNRLGGSALLECVVFGRVSGAAAANYHYKQLASGRAAGRASRIAGQLLPGGVVINVDKEAGRLTLEVGLGGGAAAPAAAAPAAAAPAAPAAPEQKEYTMEEVAKHTSKDDIWVVVNGQVLDVTTFLDDHPGGAQALLLYGGKDATEEFDMLHNADVIPKYAAHCIIGTVKK